MTVVVVPAGSLDDPVLCAWGETLEGRPDLASPFFRPEFVAAVAKGRPDVRVA